jgi:hypothetical protein
MGAGRGHGGDDDRRECGSVDLLELDGEDLRAWPLGDRKKRLARLLGKR